MSELWERMVEAAENAPPKVESMLRAALTVAAEYGQDHSLDECYPSQASCQMPSRVIAISAKLLLSLAATGGDNE